MNQPNAAALKPEDAMFELSLLNAEVSETTFDDVVVDAMARGLPPELITRLKEIWDAAKTIAGEVVAVGRIIVARIIEFVKQNPKLTIGLALGAAVAALVGGIPLIGTLLQPLSSWVAMLYGGGVGAAMQQGDYSGSPFTAATELASKFFELLVTIFKAVAGYWAAP